MWISGSASSSTMVLSTSVSSPPSFSSAFLPSERSSSRTSRGRRWKTTFTGCARTAMTLSCSSRVWRFEREQRIHEHGGLALGQHRRALGEHGLRDDDFADEVHQLVDAIEIDADGAAAGAAGRPRQGWQSIDGRVNGVGCRAAASPCA